MTAWHHTSIRLSPALRALLSDIAPAAGDRAAALRALALIGAASLGLPLNELHQELGGLLAVPLDERVHAALAQLYLAQATQEAGAHETHTSSALRAHFARTPSVRGAHAARTVAAGAEPTTGGDPFAVGVEV
jgi:hypothetical protein